jgi:LEA14-like dessication related protein
MGAFLLSNVACLGNFQEPVVRLDGVRLGSVNLAGGLLYAQLSIRNPNDFGFETRSLTYDLQIANTGEEEWYRLADGTFEEPIVIGAQDSARIEVPVEFSFMNLTGLARAFLDQGTMDYRVSGTVGLREPISRDVPYRRTGKVTLDAIR